MAAPSFKPLPPIPQTPARPSTPTTPHMGPRPRPRSLPVSPSPYAEKYPGALAPNSPTTSCAARREHRSNTLARAINTTPTKDQQQLPSSIVKVPTALCRGVLNMTQAGANDAPAESPSSIRSYTALVDALALMEFPSPPVGMPTVRVTLGNLPRSLPPTSSLPLPPISTPRRLPSSLLSNATPRLETPPRLACYPSSPTEIGSPPSVYSPNSNTGTPATLGHNVSHKLYISNPDPMPASPLRRKPKATPLVLDIRSSLSSGNSTPGSSPIDSPISAGNKAKERRMLFPSKSLPVTTASPKAASLPSSLLIGSGQMRRTGARKFQRKRTFRNICKIFDLPPELLIKVLQACIHVDIRSVGRLAATCRELSTFVETCDPVWQYFIRHEMICLSEMWSQLPDCVSSNEEFTTAPNTPPLKTWASEDNLSGLGAIGRFMLGDGSGGNNSFEWFDVSEPESNSDPGDSTHRPNRHSCQSAPSVNDSDSHVESGLTDELAHGFDALFAEMLVQNEPEEHRYRRSLVPRVTRLAHILLKLYRNTPVKAPGELATVEEWVKSPAFTNILGLVCPCPLRQDLLPALRLLCQLQTLCLKTSFPSKPDPPSPSSVTGVVSEEASDTRSERYDILKHVITLSNIPVLDVDGRVLWEIILAAEMMMFPLAGAVMIEHPSVDHFTRVMTSIARPERSLSLTPSHPDYPKDGDWSGIFGCWYGLLGRWQNGDPEPQPSLIPHINLGPCDPATMVSMIRHHEKANRVKSGRMLPLDTGLPWSKALPPVYFHGHSPDFKRNQRATDLCIRGVTRLTTDTPAEIRYTILLRKHGIDVVKFEGVQVGGVRSRRGVIGVAQYLDPDGSVKVADKEKDRQHFGMPAWFVKL